MANPIIQRGRTALITGASSGIGAAFATALADMGMSLILVARSEDALAQVAEEAKRRSNAPVHVLSMDLFRPDAATEIKQFAEKQGLSVDLLVNNAGMGVHGRFLETDFVRQRQEISLNVLALMDLTEVFLPEMRRRNLGGIINVASTAALQPLPFMAVYGATKAYVLSFTEALAVELEGSGIQMQALLPGNTETPFHSKVGPSDGRVGASRTPDQVVQTSIEAFRRGKVVAIDGAANRALSLLPRLLPRAIVAKITGRLMSPERAR